MAGTKRGKVIGVLMNRLDGSPVLELEFKGEKATVVRQYPVTDHAWHQLMRVAYDIAGDMNDLLDLRISFVTDEHTGVVITEVASWEDAGIEDDEEAERLAKQQADKAKELKFGGYVIRVVDEGSVLVDEFKLDEYAGTRGDLSSPSNAMILGKDILGTIERYERAGEKEDN